MLYTAHTKDTIAAVATPPGKGGIAIVRMSGPESIPIAKGLFKGSRDPEMLDRVMVYGHIVDNGEPIDDVLMCVMKSPHSYTSEDVVEIHCHGGYAAAGTILGILIERGARLAGPGEFTKRAFLSGKIDLVQAESIMEIVTAQSREHLRQAERLMDGAFSRRIKKLLVELHHSMTLLEMNIEFLQHGYDSIKKDELKDSMSPTIKTLNTMISSYRTAMRIKDGVQVVIAGKVNAGKSSLFNALLGRKRAIVHTTPGTTRDWLEERLELNDISINLIDTAGLRETEDDIEREGVLESERFLSEADIIVYLVEAYDSGPFCTELLNNKTVINVLSKSDLLTGKPQTAERIPVSAKTGEGLHRLTESITHMAHTLIQNTNSDSLVMVERHKIELQEAREALTRASDSIDSWSEEVTAFELQEAQKHIEAIIGRNIEYDILDSIFKNFCIGK